MRFVSRFLLAGCFALWSSAPSPSLAGETVSTPSCAADCDASGGVTVDEIMRLIGQSLGEQPLSVCPCADANRDRAVTVDEVVLSLNDALFGCTAVPATERAHGVVSLIRALAYLPSVSTAVNLGLSGAGPDPDPCLISGGFTNSCDEPSVGSVRIPVDVNACEVDAPEGRSRFDGHVDVIGRGSCPDNLVAANVRLDTQLNGRTDDLFTNRSVESEFDVDVLVRRTVLDFTQSCRVVGAEGTVDGDLRFVHSDGAETGAHLHRATTAYRFSELRHDFDCEPGIISSTVSGAIDARDAVGEGEMCGTTGGLEVQRDRRRDLLRVNGSMSTTAVGGKVTMQTISPLGSRFGDLCLRGGELEVTSGAESLRLRFQLDGSVRVNGVGGEFTIDDYACGVCGDGLVNGDEECDDGNVLADDGCSDRCIVESCFACDGEPSVCVPAEDGAVCDDGMSCTGEDRCEAGACTNHEKSCLLLTDRFAARVFSVDLETGDTRMVSDRNELLKPTGIARDSRGRLLVLSDDTGKPFRMLRIDSRTGMQQIALESPLLVGAGAPLVESDGSLLLASTYCCASKRGGLVRIDPTNYSVSVVFDVQDEARLLAPRALWPLDGDEILVAYQDTVRDDSDPGHLYRMNVSTGVQSEIALDTTIYDPMAIAEDADGRLYLLDNGMDVSPHRILRVDLADGRTERIDTEELHTPTHMVAAPGGGLLITDRPPQGGRVLFVDPVRKISRAITVDQRLAEPDGMLVLPAGNVSGRNE